MSGPQRVLITGAARGLGAALADAYRSRGARVLATDIDLPDTATVHDAGGSARLDIRSDQQWRELRELVVGEWGGLDVLVNNAGVAGGGRLDVAGVEEWQWIFDINLLGMVRGLSQFVPLLKEQRSGTIINIASLAGLVHPAGMASYNAVKAAVVALTETAGHELAAFGITAHAVCPSYFRTDLIESARGVDTAVAETMGALIEAAPLGPAEIAVAILDAVDRGEELILPDDAARAAYRLKLTDRPAYDAALRHQARRLDAAVSRGTA